MDRRQYLGLTGASIVALLGGCSSSSSQSTATATDTATATETATEISTATAAETPTEEPTETATETPEPQNLSFQDIYDEAMADASAPSVSDEVLSSVDTDDWSARDLEKVAVSAAQNARKEHSAQNIAKALYNTFSTDADELYADSRRALGRDIVKIFDQVNDEIHYLVPWASQTGEDDMLIEGENADDKTERNLAGLEDEENVGAFSALDVEQVENRIEYFGGRKNISDAEWRDAWGNFMNTFGDIIVGENYGTDEITVTKEAAKRIDAAEIEGYEGISHIREINEQYSVIKQDNDLGNGNRMRIHYNEGWNFDTTTEYDKSGYAKPPEN